MSRLNLASRSLRVLRKKGDFAGDIPKKIRKQISVDSSASQKMVSHRKKGESIVKHRVDFSLSFPHLEVVYKE